MVPASYGTFFSASVAASAALLGLLFVSISLSPETIFGESASIPRLTQAVGAFLALLDVFFVSLIALIPNTNLGYPALIVGLIAVANSLSVGLRHFASIRRQFQSNHMLLTVGSVVTYGLEVWFALALLVNQHNKGAFDALVYLLLAFYGVGVARAWELLGGGPSMGIGMLLPFLRRELEQRAREVDTSRAPIGPERHEAATDPASRRAEGASSTPESR